MTSTAAGGHGRSRALVAAMALALALIAPTAAHAARTVYVTNTPGGTGSVSQFSVDGSGLLTALSPATVATEQSPEPMAISPDGRSLYVGNRAPSNSVSQYDIDAFGHATPKTPASVPAGAEPKGVAVSPNGLSVYVVNNGAATISQYDVDAAGRLTPKSPPTVAAGTDPFGIALTPDGHSAYVVEQTPQVVRQYDIDAFGHLTPKTPPTVPSSAGTYWPAVSPDGHSLYVSGSPISQYDIGADGKLTPKTPATVAAGTSAEVIAPSPSGRSVYMADDPAAGGTIFQYDVGSGGVLTPKSPATVALGAGIDPIGFAVSPNSASAYTADDLGTAVFQFNADAAGLLSPKAPPTVPGPSTPDHVLVSPDQAPVAAFSGAATAAASQAVAFDGSASSDPDGTVARYDWDFGDGVKAANAGAKPTHAFGAGGTFTVRLTVTDNEGCSTAFLFTGQTASCNGSATATTTHAVAVTGSGGPGVGSAGTVAITRLRLSAKVFHAAKSGASIVAARRIPVGTTISYRDTQAARTTFTVLKPVRGVRRAGRCRAPKRGQHGGKRCTRYISAGTFAHKDVAGVNRFKFTGRVKRHKLKHGRYRLRAIAKVGTRSGRAVTTPFRIV